MAENKITTDVSVLDVQLLLLEGVFTKESLIFKDIRQLWADYELGNNFSYFPYDVNGDMFVYDEDTDELSDIPSYPYLHELLEDSGVTECLIHYEW